MVHNKNINVLLEIIDRAKRGLLQKAIILKFGVKGGHYWSEGFVCLSVIRGAYADNLTDAVDRLLITDKHMNTMTRILQLWGNIFADRHQLDRVIQTHYGALGELYEK